MNKLFETICAGLLIAVWVLAIVGWFLNIIKIADAHDVTGMVIVRAVGIFVAPLGALVGWF
jgi:hypothetical protein